MGLCSIGAEALIWTCARLGPRQYLGTCLVGAEALFGPMLNWGRGVDFGVRPVGAEAQFGHTLNWMNSPVPGANAGSRPSISNEMYTGPLPIIVRTSSIRGVRDLYQHSWALTTRKP